MFLSGWHGSPPELARMKLMRTMSSHHPSGETVLKKAGIIVVGSAAVILAASPLALADSFDHSPQCVSATQAADNSPRRRRAPPPRRWVGGHPGRRQRGHPGQRPDPGPDRELQQHRGRSRPERHRQRSGQQQEHRQEQDGEPQLVQHHRRSADPASPDLAGTTGPDSPHGGPGPLPFPLFCVGVIMSKLVLGAASPWSDSSPRARSRGRGRRRAPDRRPPRPPPRSADAAPGAGAARLPARRRQRRLVTACAAAACPPRRPRTSPRCRS